MPLWVSLFGVPSDPLSGAPSDEPPDLNDQPLDFGGYRLHPLKVDTTPPFPCAQPRFFARCELEGPNPRQALRGDLFQARWPQWELEA